MRDSAARLLCISLILGIVAEFYASPAIALVAPSSSSTIAPLPEQVPAEPPVEPVVEPFPVSRTAADLKMVPEPDEPKLDESEPGDRNTSVKPLLESNWQKGEPESEPQNLENFLQGGLDPVSVEPVSLELSGSDSPANSQLLLSALAQASNSSTDSVASEQPASDTSTPAPEAEQQLDLDPEIIENSPVLQRWLDRVPDVLSEIRRDPSFRTRLRLGYSQFPANEQAAGFNLGVEDVFLGRTSLTLSASYQNAFSRQQEAYGADLRYYVLPLGGYLNVAPVVGYRHIDTDRYSVDGLNLGFRILFVPSRTGAADISFTQSWVAPGTDEEVGISTLSFGYALTHNLRLSTDLQKQNAPQRKDSRVAVVLEWML